MVDVSGSTKHIQHRIVSAVERVCQEREVRHSANSLLVLYSDKVEACLPLKKVGNVRELIVNAVGGGTSLTSALREVTKMLASDVRTPSIVLVFTDDDTSELLKGSGNVTAIVDELHSMKVQLKVFEATDSSDTVLSAFTKDNQIQYERV